MWISGGDQSFSDNIVHMVLAVIPGSPPGSKGISLFLVPKHLPSGERNDVYVGQFQHKMGAAACTNAEMVLGEKSGEGAVGYLVGNVNEGLKCMFCMMNEARIFVGATAVGSGIAGYQASLQYARDRRQGRHPSLKDPSTPMVRIIEHSDVNRMLLQQKAYVEGSLALCVYTASIQDHMEQCTSDPEEKQRLNMLLEFLIPITKAWPSEW